jgi:multiple sugar transport system ATP-binding protein
MNIVAGLEEPTTGKLQLAGRDITQLEPDERDVAMVFQSYALYPNMTVAQNIAFPLEMRKVPKAERDKAVADVAQMLQIGHLLDRKPRQLSGGQRQRVAIGRAIVRNPKVFLFDEPLSNLDAALRTKMRVELATLHRRLGATMIYVTHDQVEAMTLADKIVVLNKGRIEQVGAPLELYHRPATRFVAGFIGSPQMNFIEGAHAQAQGAHCVGVRPEHLHLATDGPIEGTLRHAELLGNETFAYIDAGALGELTARVEGSISAQPGQTLRLGYRPEHLYRFDAAGLRL